MCWWQGPHESPQRLCFGGFNLFENLFAKSYERLRVTCFVFLDQFFDIGVNIDSVLAQMVSEILRTHLISSIFSNGLTDFLFVFRIERDCLWVFVTSPAAESSAAKLFLKRLGIRRAEKPLFRLLQSHSLLDITHGNTHWASLSEQVVQLLRRLDAHFLNILVRFQKLKLTFLIESNNLSLVR